MARTYAQVRKQIDALQREAEKLKQQEVDGVIAKIRTAIDAYGLTAADLGLVVKRGPKPGSKRVGKKKVGKTKAKAGTKAVKFRDAAGNTWVGRGPRPQWLREALAAGKKVEDFAV